MEGEQVDVVICGSGSGGLGAATYLARCGVKCKVLERMDGPLEIGKADGVQCRTVELYDSFGMAEELIREGYHVCEVTFWAPGPAGGIVRTGRTADMEPGLSHQPHLIRNQARMHEMLLGAMQRFNRQDVDYGYEIKDVCVDEASVEDPKAYCVKVTAMKDSREEVFLARYVLGADGAHSVVRRSLGFKMIGDSLDSAWGVMDVYPRTNFPDIRKKSAIQSPHGSLIIIPREDGFLCRLYVEMGSAVDPKGVTLEELHSKARSIFSPYTLEVAATYWWSVYSIGQRLTNGFSKNNRVFLSGDACHTHSPKAGQGMNVSLQDGYNLGWKLAAVLKGQATPDILRTYNIEREKVAADLIDFDRKFMRALEAKEADQNGTASEKFADVFVKAGRYTAGLTARYDDSLITWGNKSDQDAASNLQVGMRFPSTQAVRLCDAKAMHLTKALPADGRWRIIVFSGDLGDLRTTQVLSKLGDYLDSEEGPVRKFTRKGEFIDSFIESIVVLAGEKADKTKVDVNQLPSYFVPVTGKWHMRDLHKIFIDDESYNHGHGRAYEFYGVDPQRGAIVVVRPDQYVSMVIGVDNFELLGEFFSSFSLRS